jgi:ABC-2 type transport system ATP-binding protein
MTGAFSSGMRQRLLIARALLARPKVLLLDEPTRSLDPISARTFRQFLREEIVGAQGCTVVLATHSADEAFELCDRVAVLDRGRLLACGPALALARAYSEERHHLWTTHPGHEAFTKLVHRGLVERSTPLPDRDGDWHCVEVVLRGGMNDSAAVVSALAREGVPVARFERLALSLADLLERVVASRNPEVRRG